MSIGTLIVLAAVIAIVVLIIRIIKLDKSSCGMSCADCTMSEECHKSKK